MHSNDGFIKITWVFVVQLQLCVMLRRFKRQSNAS